MSTLRRDRPEYVSWASMIKRCSYAYDHCWHLYGGRGIKVCARWRGRDGFLNFLADMGPRPCGYSIDRIDNDGNYEPGNCRWATISEQLSNRRPKTHCRRGHEFSPDNTHIRVRDGRPRRECRACWRINSAAYTKRKAAVAS